MTPDRSLTLFGQTMAYVVATAGLFALGPTPAATSPSRSVGLVIAAIVSCSQ